MKSIGTELMQIYKDLTENELLEGQIKFAKFNQELLNIYNSKISSIEKNIDDKILYYGRNIEDYSAQKENILNKYTEEFQKIYDQRKMQFFNIENEITEIQSNQKIAITNFYKVVDDRNKFLKTEKYNEYLSQKQEFQEIVNSTLNHDEFDKYTKLLEELVDPLEEYNKMMIGLLQKYNGYDALIVECDKKLEECLIATKSDFEKISRFRNQSLAVINKKNFVVAFFEKILNKFSGASKLEKEFIQEIENELSNIEKENNSIVSEISSQTNRIVELIENVRSEINSNYKFVVG